MNVIPRTLKKRGMSDGRLERKCDKKMGKTAQVGKTTTQSGLFLYSVQLLLRGCQGSVCGPARDGEHGQSSHRSWTARRDGEAKREEPHALTDERPGCVGRAVRFASGSKGGL